MDRVDGFPSPAFLRCWRASAVSGVGTYVTLLALQALVVLTLDGSAADVGLLNAARWLPFLLLGLVIGAVVDGRRRLPLMVSTDLVQAGLLTLVPCRGGRTCSRCRRSSPSSWRMAGVGGERRHRHVAATASWSRPTPCRPGRTPRCAH